MAGLPPVPYKTRVLDQMGFLSRAWADWFRRSTDWSRSEQASGYQRLPSGLYLFWGVTDSVTSGSTESITLPVAVSSSILQAFASIRDNSAVATTATGQWGTGNYAATGFDIYNRTSVACVFNWFAVGV